MDQSMKSFMNIMKHDDDKHYYNMDLKFKQSDLSYLNELGTHI